MHKISVLELNQHLIFGDAHYEIQKHRQVRLRRPEELPLEEEIDKLREHTLEKLTEIVSDEYRVWDLHAFVELRDHMCSRLTLWNARRGGEPSRLRIQDWRDAEDGARMDRNQMEEVGDPAQEIRATAQFNL